MRFVSTRSPKGPELDFRQALFQGLAPDGGLYQPRRQPDLRDLIASFNASTSFQEIAASLTRALFPQDLGRNAEQISARAFPFSPELRKLEEGHYILELFHGPSCAFKDFGASYLATVMEEYLKEGRQRAIILTATSGDTGSAVAQAFHGKESIEVVILYPSGRVSPSQEQQLTTLGGNVHALEVRGSFDDCQRMVKEAFVHPELSAGFPLTSANSINLGRLIPQSFYYIWAQAQLKDRAGSELSFCVPSGNFGNLTAGVMAWAWGLPLRGFLAASNANDVVPAYLRSGEFLPRPSVHTKANAMDVGNPSNFERLSAIFGNDASRMRKMIKGSRTSDAEILDVIKEVYQRHGHIVCPHTAVGIHAVWNSGLKLAGSQPALTLATAHPGKFPEIIQEALGQDPPIPERLAEFMRRKKEATLLGNRLEDLRAYLESHLA